MKIYVVMEEETNPEGELVRTNVTSFSSEAASRKYIKSISGTPRLVGSGLVKILPNGNALKARSLYPPFSFPLNAPGVVGAFELGLKLRAMTIDDAMAMAEAQVFKGEDDGWDKL